MTKLPAPEQWVLSQMSEMEVAEMIEQHIDYIDQDGKSVHLPMQFVRHYMRRDDSALPHRGGDRHATDRTGRRRPAGAGRSRSQPRHHLRNPEGGAGDHSRPQGLPQRGGAAGDAASCATTWLCDVATDYAGKCTIIAAALTIIERSLLDERPAFFVTAGRRGGGKTTLLYMLIMAVTGIMPAASAWSNNEEERRKALLSYFLYGVPLYSLGQHRARQPDQLPAHRAVVHRQILHRPQARCQRSGRDRRVDHPPLHRQQYQSARRSRLAQPAHPSHCRSPRSGKSRTSSIPIRSDGPKTTAPKSCRPSTPSCSATRS